MTPHAPVVLDIAGTTLTADDRRRLKHPLTGGLILFARNWQDRAQLTTLCADIKAVRDDLLICVDHEGGRVQRFRTDGFSHLPPMRELGRLWMRDPMAATDAASAAGFVLASELRACGVDLSFTPVLDLDHGPSGVIGDRAFHRDPRVATLLAKSLMHGLLRAGMANCGKHFPGHGYVKADSHVAVPVDRRSLKAILADDARPYEWLSSTLTSVMPAHVVYTEGRRAAGRLFAALAEGHPARPARLHRRCLQRRPQHGGRAPPGGARAQLRRGGGAGAGRRLRHGAAVQPERRRRRSGRQPARRAAGAGRRRPLGARSGRRDAPPGDAARQPAADLGRR